MKKKGLIVLISILVVSLLVPLEGGRIAATGEKWVAKYNGPANGEDRAQAVAVDASGNVYVTGRSKGAGTDFDYATVKYSPGGQRLWVMRYNGPANGEDWAQAVAVDGSGNVYVTGRSKGAGTDFDYATIKYNTNGKQLWVQRYNGPVNGFDGAGSIAVDGSGNVCVTGASLGSSLQYDCDYATLKYSPAGKQLWVQRYNGPLNADDYARALALDGSGNVYVTGESPGSGTSDDYATLKYGANGNLFWVKRYNGPRSDHDYARAIAVDGSGNVYVAGVEGYEANVDFATLKCGANGNLFWVKRYNGPGDYYDEAWAMAVDGSGNVYVAGGSTSSSGSYDLTTVKYGPNGKQLWVNRYKGDAARAVAVDGSGNVYVVGSSLGSGTGYDYVILKY
jgi:uncharacterized delta-60 repeat protein